MSNEALRNNINKARDVTLENYLNLTKIYEDQCRGYFVKQGAKVSTPRRFVRNIGFWVKRRGEVARSSNLVSNNLGNLTRCLYYCITSGGLKTPHFCCGMEQEPEG